MPGEPSKAPLPLYSRRTFFRLGTVGLASLIAGGVARFLAGPQEPASRLPGPGSIFEPRRDDLLRRWRKRLSSLRLL
ncbi:MAG: hypothetical protein HY535_06905 [Chloroflexi bacterium]|nr:hypothetical protein [Chloroflexota bacterium]